MKLHPADVWHTAATSPRLAVALAGRDPDDLGEQGRMERAHYLYLIALGLPAARAEQAIGSMNAGKWRGQDPNFALACKVVAKASQAYAQPKRPRITPDAIERFLTELRKGGMVKDACALAGVTPAAMYQRRKRDGDFARVWNQAARDGAAAEKQ
ncbi:hypothetical protein [Streptomyces sp. NBC_01304]|uniref:hypothetical protein n=1 Tax=Streptomyces sp. NBC_01304 TaxID=2903818 RepID=UPI002E131235|nr:hypothetical protein OG430_44610 [Streptomyces sp. NBC_01304]